jgi:hypothetical protein
VPSAQLAQAVVTVVERDDDRAHAPRRQTMQQTLGLKRFALNHIGGAFLVFGMLVSSLSVVATLSVTGDFPGAGHAESARVATSGSPRRVTAAVAEQHQLRMDRDDFRAWQSQARSMGATSSMNAVVDQMVAFFDAKLARLEATELHISQTAAQAVAEQQQLRMDRADFLTGRR